MKWLLQGESERGGGCVDGLGLWGPAMTVRVEDDGGGAPREAGLTLSLSFARSPAERVTRG